MPLLPFDYLHSLGGLKGWTRGQPVDFEATLNPTDMYNCYPGRCVHLDPAGAGFTLGCPALSMPMFLTRGITSLDVINDSGAPWVAGLPGGLAAALVANGSYELETTEFDPSLETVNRNTPLMSPQTSDITAGSGQVNAGLLYATKNWAGGGGGTPQKGTDSIVAIVSRGIYASKEHPTVQLMAFWPIPIF